MSIDLARVSDIAAFIALAFAIYAYIQATRQLKTESANLRHLNDLILIALQNNGMADLRRDKDGRIIGLNISVPVPSGKITTE